MSVTCTVVATQLPRIVDGRPMRPRAAHHVGRCLTCQAEAVRYRAMARHLRGLVDIEVVAPDELADSVNAAIDSLPGAPHSRQHRLERVVVTGAAVAIAGTVAVLARRRKRAA